MQKCKKCRKEIPDGSLYCCWCGKKQETAPRKKAHKRAHGSGTIHKDPRYNKPYIAFAPASPGGRRIYVGAFSTYGEASAALDDFVRNGRPELYNATFGQIYKLWSEAHTRHYPTTAYPYIHRYGVNTSRCIIPACQNFGPLTFSA